MLYRSLPPAFLCYRTAMIRVSNNRFVKPFSKSPPLSSGDAPEDVAGKPFKSLPGRAWTVIDIL
jgi:hypothetical protein